MDTEGGRGYWRTRNWRSVAGTNPLEGQMNAKQITLFGYPTPINTDTSDYA